MPQKKKEESLEVRAEQQASQFTSALAPIAALLKVNKLPKKQEAFTSAADQLLAARNLIDEVEEDRKTITRPLDTAKKAVMAKYKPITDPLKEAIEHIEARLMAGWSHERRTEHVTKMEKVALDAEKRGEHQYAADIREAAENLDRVIPKIPFNERRKWSARVTDVKALFLAIVEGKAPAPPKKVVGELEKWLSGLARSEKQQTNIPGVRYVYTVSYARRSKA